MTRDAKMFCDYFEELITHSSRVWLWRSAPRRSATSLLLPQQEARQLRDTCVGMISPQTDSQQPKSQ